MKIEVLEALTLRMCVAEDYGSGGVGPTDALLEAWTFIRGVEPSLTIAAQTAHTMTGCYPKRQVHHTHIHSRLSATWLLLSVQPDS